MSCSSRAAAYSVHAPPGGSSVEGDMRGKTVLVVDDEKLVRWSIRQKLEGAGYRVLEAGDGASAISLFREHLPDLVTLDVRLPDSNGLKLLLEMKRIASDTPIIMITAYGAVDDAVKALQIGSL